MSPEVIRALDLASLAERTLKSLGVNSNKPTAETVMDHAMAQVCLELEIIEKVIEQRFHDDAELDCLVYVVSGIRERLELARECSGTLATLMAEGSAGDIIARLSEAANG